MTLRTTLAVLLIGLLAWGVTRILGEPEAPPPPRVPLVPEELLARWSSIELTLLSGEELRIERQPGAVIVRFGEKPQNPNAPVPAPPPGRFELSDPADLDRVEQLVLALRDSWREPLQGGADAVVRSGLRPPRHRLVLRAGEEQLALGFGNEDQVGGGVLARDESGEEVFRTGRQVVNLLDLNRRDWRSRQVFSWDPMIVTRIEVTRWDPVAPDSPPEVLAVEREGPRTWRIASPRSLLADPQACAGLAQRASLLRIHDFLAHGFTPQVIGLTGLPDAPLAQITLAAGDAVQVLDIGRKIEAQGYACFMKERSADVCFAIPEESLDAILSTSVDSLRMRRLWPRVETSLVGLACRGQDGAERWRFAREGDHPRGDWSVRAPFAAKANAGRGAHSFAQVVADVDRTEVDEYLPPGTPFQPEGTIELRWFSQPIVVTASFEVARGDGGTIVRDPNQPGELFQVSSKIGDLLGLDVELHRDPTIFPRGELMNGRLLRWRLERPGRPPLSISRDGVTEPARPDDGTPASLVSRLQSEPAALYGELATGYVRAAEVAAAGGADPFAQPALSLTLTLLDETGAGTFEETLVVGGEVEGGLCCKLLPRLPEDVWIVIPRVLLDPLLRLARE